SRCALARRPAVLTLEHEEVQTEHVERRAPGRRQQREVQNVAEVEGEEALDARPERRQPRRRVPRRGIDAPEDRVFGPEAREREDAGDGEAADEEGPARVRHPLLEAALA